MLRLQGKAQADPRKADPQKAGPHQVWLHIGHGKTGTTALQTYFVHRTSCDPRFHFPVTGRRSSGAHHDVFPLEHQAGLLKSAASLLAELRAEIKSRPPEHLTVLSSEHLCYFRPWQAAQVIKALKGVDVRLLYYVRRQDELMESAYKWRLADGPDSYNGITDFVRHQVRGFDFLQRIAPWTAHVSDDRFRARLYHRETCAKDIVSDVEQVLGLDPLDRSGGARVHRESLNIVMIEILRAFDRAHPQSKQRQGFLSDLREVQTRLEVKSDRGLMPQALKCEIMARYQLSNSEFSDRFMSEADRQILLQRISP